MSINWVEVYNRLFQIINPDNRNASHYFPGSRFIGKVREVKPYFPNYSQFMDERQQNGENSRQDYYDILLDLDKSQRVWVLHSILNVGKILIKV